ncbi:MAG: hypothetical protein ACOC44_10730 [Promethearchaeia archaeon]
MAKLLISGIAEYSAGKTTVARALIRYFNEKSQSVSGFKPRSGNNIWYHWKLIREGLDQGTIFSKDAKLLQSEMKNKIPLTLINPVHRLWTMSSENSAWNSLPHFLMDRINFDNKQYILLNKQQDLPVKREFFETLFKKSEVIEIKSRDELQEYSSLYGNATSQAHETLCKKFENIIIESYSNIAVPLRKISDLDFVFITRPFHIDIYKGERFLQALELLSTLPIEQNTEHVIESIKPVKKIKVPPYDKKVIDHTTLLLKSIMDELL